MNNNAESIAKKLAVETLPLQGVHLIEASAGTGKTFNITRIYLRLLLERKLKVQNILVVTFTKAATEELRGRIDSEIRDTLENWGQRDASDPFYQVLEKSVAKEEARLLLREALTNMDEASIFTIHGFCKRVLSQQAFSSGLSFDIEMEVDSQEIKLEVTRDWYRRLESKPEQYLLVSEYWLTPADFLQSFGPLYVDGPKLQGSDPEEVEKAFLEQKYSAKRLLESGADSVFSELINSHKDSESRTAEYHCLLSWLSEQQLQPMPKKAAQVFDGKRYAKKTVDCKNVLNTIFDPLKILKKQSEKIADQIKRAKAEQIALNAIIEIRDEVIVRKNRVSMLDFDDLIRSLLNGIKGEGGTALMEQLLAQYPVALVDEFQDTDPNQYDIFKRVYANRPETAMYMIGDPKQAIYGFRGGDVFAYLAARDDASQQWFMDTNWRSSTAMVTAYNRLFYGKNIPEAVNNLQQEQTTHVFKYGIGYIPVRPSGTQDDNEQVRTVGKPLKYIYFPEDENYGKKANNQQFRTVIADWCAAQIVKLINGSELTPKVAENDIAVLVRDRIEAEEIQQALGQLGCASVYLSTRENVFESPEALELLAVLKGILWLEDERMMVAALATRLCGYDAKLLHQLQSDEVFWEDTRLRFLAMRSDWERNGIMAMVFKLIHENYKPDPARHERALTNTIHLAELLQHASQRHRRPWELISWFQEKTDCPAADSEAELRLESDANLIKIITLHGSKGLEYPVVFIPFASRAKGAAKSTPAYYRYHDKTSKQSISYVGYNPEIQQLSQSEQQAEDVRLLYVAVTRAKFACYVCATPFADYHRSPLGLMLGLRESEDLKAELASVVADTPTAADLVVVEASGRPDLSLLSGQQSNTLKIDEQSGQSTTEVKVERILRRIEDNWWIASFSAITRNIRHGSMAEPDRDSDALLSETEVEQSEALRFVLKKGAATGNLLHDILETVDFEAPDWSAAMAKPLLRYSEIEQNQIPELVTWLEACIEAELAPQLSLGQLANERTLRETEFYFPMSRATRPDLAKLLQRHRQSDRFPVLPEGNLLQGMMHGFIDLIFEWGGKYYVVDYKSTHLGDRFDDYNIQNLTENIEQNFYDLQYLIYSVALHRYLTLRIENYSPERHLGGVYYLYLRGMTTGRNTGIYYNAVDPQMLEALDRLFKMNDLNSQEGQHNPQESDFV